MTAETIFKQDYEKHLHHLKLKGLQPKTIDAYSRSIRYIGKYFDYEIKDLSEQQLVDYFVDRLGTHSWSAVKLDLYGLPSNTVLTPAGIGTARIARLTRVSNGLKGNLKSRFPPTR